MPPRCKANTSPANLQDIAALYSSASIVSSFLPLSEVVLDLPLQQDNRAAVCYLLFGPKIIAE